MQLRGKRDPAAASQHATNDSPESDLIVPAAMSLHGLPPGGSGASPHAMAHACCSAPVFVAQPMKQLPQVGAMPIIPMTADVVSLAVTTDMSCSSVHGAAAASSGASSGDGGGGGGGADSCVGGDGRAGSSAGAPCGAGGGFSSCGGGGAGAPPLAHAIAQLVESFAVAHPIRHCPHGGLLPMSPITADVLSAAVPTFVTSAIVHAAAAGGGAVAFGAAVAGGGAGVGAGGAPPLAHAIAQLVESFAVAHPIRHCPQGGLLPMSPITADVLSAADPTFITSAIVHAAASA